MDYPSSVSLPGECSLGKRMLLPGERAPPGERDYLSDVRYRGERERKHSLGNDIRQALSVSALPVERHYPVMPGERTPSPGFAAENAEGRAARRKESRHSQSSGEQRLPVASRRIA